MRRLPDDVLAKLDGPWLEEQVSAGRMQLEIAQELGVSPSTIKRACASRGIAISREARRTKPGLSPPQPKSRSPQRPPRARQNFSPVALELALKERERAVLSARER